MKEIELLAKKTCSRPAPWKAGLVIWGEAWPKERLLLTAYSCFSTSERSADCMLETLTKRMTLSCKAFPPSLSLHTVKMYALLLSFFFLLIFLLFFSFLWPKKITRPWWLHCYVQTLFCPVFIKPGRSRLKRNFWRAWPYSFDLSNNSIFT